MIQLQRETLMLGMGNSIRWIGGSALLMTLTATDPASAQRADASQRLTIEVRPVTSLVVTADPRPLVVSREAGREGVQSVTDRGTQYSLLTNIDNMRISASIDRNMPPGTSLKINLGSSIGKSRGDVDISNAMMPVDVVTNIARGGEQDQGIAYTFIAGSDVRAVGPETRTIVLTLTN